jgi:hypothetical protein
MFICKKKLMFIFFYYLHNTLQQQNLLVQAARHTMRMFSCDSYKLQTSLFSFFASQSPREISFVYFSDF